ncbi:MAG: dipeptide ABC transporter ATP-binding protein [Candidatus Hydrogenedens sp.]|nr:dipeptide ABC transporter ATP-binding protein [Candidatus Hydrogenedens sp.]
MSTPLLQVEGLTKHFPVKAGVLSRTVGAVRAVEDVSFTVERGKTLSLVGESGSGKTTAGRCLLRLIEPTAGTIRFDGQDITRLSQRELRPLRKRMQIIFQDPYGSLNPRMTVFTMLAEAMRAHGLHQKQPPAERVQELLQLVGLPSEAAHRYPHEFSGGQRQRVGIARALAVEPELIVADEAVSALDVSIQAQILNLLKELQERLGLSYVFIAHDLSVVRHLSHEVAVMYLGRIVEHGPAESVFAHPVHPYTRALLASVPMVDPGARRERVPLRGETPSPLNPPAGCAFHPRCPDAIPACSERMPGMGDCGNRHGARCMVHAPE